MGKKKRAPRGKTATKARQAPGKQKAPQKAAQRAPARSAAPKRKSPGRSAREAVQQAAEAAWDQIEALGGGGVWEGDMVIVTLSRTAVRDRDLELFRDFPFVRTLDLSFTKITDEGLAHLVDLPEIEDLIIVSTEITAAGIKRFQKARPKVSVTTRPTPKDAINPFTGQPMG